MGDTTGISWADMTYNPWLGCTKVSPACQGCYAEQLMDHRMHRVTWGQPGERGTRVQTAPANRRKPLLWEKQAIRDGTRPFVFSLSLGDIFDNQVDPDWRREAFDVARATPHLVWLYLTKRPQQIVKLAEEAGGLPPNAALGATMEDRLRTAQNGKALYAAGRKLKPLFIFASLEPLLEDVCDELEPWLYKFPGGGISWVLTGGETSQGDHRARHTDPAIFRRVRDLCARDGIVYHHKQMTEGAEIPEDLRIQARPRVPALVS